LQRPPLDIFTLVKTAFPLSKIAIFREELAYAMLIAEKKPAAPPPTIRTS